MHVIGVAGQLANGKDVLSDYLAEKLNSKHEIQWERSAFANAVKNIYMNAFGKDKEFIEEWKRKKEAPPGMLMPVRKGLQFIGDGFRKIKDEIWIDIALRDNKKLIISDSRYFNEAKAIKAKKGFTLIIYRPGFLNDDPCPSESQIGSIVHYFLKNNIQEGPIKNTLNQPEELSYYDYFLINDGSLQDLYNKIDQKLIPYIEDFYYDQSERNAD